MYITIVKTKNKPTNLLRKSRQTFAILLGSISSNKPVELSKNLSRSSFSFFFITSLLHTERKTCMICCKRSLKNLQEALICYNHVHHKTFCWRTLHLLIKKMQHLFSFRNHHLFIFQLLYCRCSLIIYHMTNYQSLTSTEAYLQLTCTRARMAKTSTYLLQMNTHTSKNFFHLPNSSIILLHFSLEYSVLPLKSSISPERILWLTTDANTQMSAVN